MRENKQDNENPKTTKRKKNRVWLAAIVVVLTVIIACTLWSLRNSNSIDKRLAAIEAARAIPDSENAAVVYNQLMQAPYPIEVDAHEYIIDKLIEAARLEKCRFPIIPAAESAPTQTNRLRAMKSWAVVLQSTAQNDLADARIDDAITKWRCILQMGNHLRQHPLFPDYLVATAIEAIPLYDARVFVVEGNAANAHLNLIEAMPVLTEDRWPATLAEITPVVELVERKFINEELELLDRIEYEFDRLLGRTNDGGTQRIAEISRRLLTTSRGLHILVALRRYKNKYGCWPQSLDEIQSQVPAQVLIDPFNNGPFLYMLTADGFELYSIGPNKTDENGKYEPGGPDDWPIWPPYKTKPKQMITNTQPPDPNADQEQ